MKIKVTTFAQVSILIGGILLGFSGYNYGFGEAHYDTTVLHLMISTRWHVYLPEWLLYGTLILAGLSTYHNTRLAYFLFLTYATLQLCTFSLNVFTLHLNESHTVLSALCLLGLKYSGKPETIEWFALEKPIPIWKPIATGVILFVLSFSIQLIQ